uniref:hypothetical protein n=1 Tax=Candidatus Avalokitesvara rifleensis TaxID=3367620 RepID=UPI00402A0743
MFDMYHYVEIGRLLVQVIGAYLLFRKVFTYALSTYISLVTLLFGPLASVALISRTYIDSVQWFPWILYFIIRLVEGGGIRELVYIAFLTGIAMGGPPRADSIQILFAIFIFAVSLLITHRNALVGVLARQKPVYLGLCLLLGTFLCAHVASLSKDTDKVFPVMQNEYRTGTMQSILSPEIADVYSESVRDIVRLLLPVKKHIQPYLDRWNADFLIGIVPVLLFWVGLIIGRNRYKTNFFILMLFMAFVAMGRNTAMLQIIRIVFAPMKQTVFATTSGAMMFLAHGFFVGLCIDAIVSLINNRKSTINDDNNKSTNGRSYYTLQEAKSFLLQWDHSIKPFILLFLVFVFTFLNLHLHRVTSEKLPQLPMEVKFPDHLKGKIRYDVSRKLLIFEGVMSLKERDDLLKLTSVDDKMSAYHEAITALYKRSRMFTASEALYAVLRALVMTALVYLFFIKATFLAGRHYGHTLRNQWTAWKTALGDGAANSPILRWCARYWPLIVLSLTPIVLAFAFHQERQLISLQGLLLMLTCLIIIYAATTLTQNLASIARGALAVACIFFMLLLYGAIELPGQPLTWVLYGEFILLVGMVFYYLSKRFELNSYNGFLLILSVAVACELFMVHRTYLVYHLRDRSPAQFNTRPQKPQMTNRIPLLPWTDEYQPWDTPFRPIYYRENVAINEILPGKGGSCPTEATIYARAYDTPKGAPSCNFWPKTYLPLYEIGEVNLKVFEVLMGLKSGQTLLDFYPRAI